MKNIFLLTSIIGFLFLVSCSEKKNETKPQRKNITEMVFASGMLEADNQYNLAAQTDGYLVKMTFEEGVFVNKGKVIAEIDNDQNRINAQTANELNAIAHESTLSSAPALLEIKASIEAASAKVVYCEQQFERYKRLYERQIVSRVDYENAQLNLTNAQANLKIANEQYQKQKIRTKQEAVVQQNARKINNVINNQNLLIAIKSGKVYEKRKQLGDYVRKGDVIAVVGSPDVIYAKLNVDETNMSRLKNGQTVIIRLNTNKDKMYKATIKQILPAFDETSRSFIIKAYFDEKLDFKITGTPLEANILIGTKKNALVIPLSYLGYGNKVMLSEDAKVITVKTGIISNEWAEIVSGLKVGQTIIKEDP